VSKLELTGAKAKVTWIRIVASFVASIAVLLALNIDPVFPKYDDGWFFLVSYSWLNGFGFANHWVGFNGTSIFNWHGFLQPLLVTGLSPCGTLACVKIGLMMLQASYVLIWFVAVESIAAGRLLRWCLYVIGPVTMLQYSARPELLASLEMNVLFLSFVELSSRRRYGYWPRAVCSGALVGLAIMTDPVAGVLSGLGSAAAICCYRDHPPTALGLFSELLVLTAAALASAVLCLVVLYPYDPLSWVTGMREHAELISGRSDFGGFERYYVYSRLSPLLILMFVPLTAAILWSLRAARKLGNLSVALTIVVEGAFVLIVYWTAIRVPAAYYNFNAIVPTLSLIVAGLSTEGFDYRPAHYLRGALSVSITFFALAGLGALVIIGAEKIYFGPQQAQLKKEIASFVKDALQQGRRVALDPPLIQAIDDIAVMKQVKLLFFSRPGKGDDWPDDIDIIIRAQTEFGTLPRPPGHSELVINAFDSNLLDSFIKPESLNYAVYRRAK
jgi:hypothetical protein